MSANLRADGRLELTFPKSLAADDALIAIEISTDLSAWAPAGTMFDLDSEIHNGDGTATFIFESNVPVSGERFYARLKVTSR